MYERGELPIAFVLVAFDVEDGRPATLRHAAVCWPIGLKDALSLESKQIKREQSGNHTRRAAMDVYCKCHAENPRDWVTGGIRCRPYYS